MPAIMVDMHVTDLRVYPVKSLAGESVGSARVEPWGLAGDRRWGLVDPDGHKVTALLDSRLLGLSATVAGDGVTLRCGGETRTARPPAGGRAVAVGGTPGASAVPVDAEVDAWLSGRVGRPLRLVWQPDPADRPMPAARGGWPGEVLSLAWGSPLVLTTRPSLRRLQGWVDEAAADRGEVGERLSTWRFRPNVVLDGGAPFAEDGWTEVRLGDVPCRVSGLCDRCAVTAVDPDTLRRGREPIRTLLARRSWEGATWFGVRLVPLATGEVRVGDEAVAQAGGPAAGPPRPVVRGGA